MSETRRPIALLARENPHIWRSDAPLSDWWWWNGPLVRRAIAEILLWAIFAGAGVALATCLLGCDRAPRARPALEAER